MADLEQFEMDVTALESDPEYALDEEDGMYPWVRRDAGEMMQHWHRSMNDPVYAVGSFYFADKDYPDVEIVQEALESLQSDLEDPADDWSEDDLLELETIIRFLEWQLEHVYPKLRRNRRRRR